MVKPIFAQGLQLKQSLAQKQSQSLAMTPQMQQAIALLQMNNLELETLIAEEVAQNPLLEREGRNIYERDADKDLRQKDAPSDAPLNDKDMGAQMRKGEMLGASEVADYENRWDVDSPAIRHAARATLETSRELANPGQVIEESVFEPATLQTYLRTQIADENLVPVIRQTCLALIEWIDEKGYLREDDKELTQTLGIDVYALHEALGFCRALQPAGVFARTLPECLSLQLRARDLWSPAHDVMLENLNMIMQGALGKLARLCRVTPARLDRMIHDLRTLDPHPGLAFEVDMFQARPPEVLVSEDSTTQIGWRIELNEETLPRVVVQTGYWEELAAKKMSKEDRKYLQRHYQSGQWLVRAMTQRAATLLQVGQEICRRQKGFLQKGVQSLKPMVMRDIAEALDIHESTVSRVVANKLMQTPRGVFEMKYFFTSAIRTSARAGAGAGVGGAKKGAGRVKGAADAGKNAEKNAEKNSGEMSSKAVRAHIVTLIENELTQGAQKILSDDALAKILQGEGIAIARRTVAKYREAMGLPDSAARKRAAKMPPLK